MHKFLCNLSLVYYSISFYSLPHASCSSPAKLYLVLLKCVCVCVFFPISCCRCASYLRASLFSLWRSCFLSACLRGEAFFFLLRWPWNWRWRDIGSTSLPPLCLRFLPLSSRTTMPQMTLFCIAALCLYRYFPTWRLSRSMKMMYLCVSHLSEHLGFPIPPSPPLSYFYYRRALCDLIWRAC